MPLLHRSCLRVTCVTILVATSALACHRDGRRADTSEAVSVDPSEPSPAAQDACPTPFMPVPASACTQTGDYGLSKENPAEWGFGAGTRTLWFGRMVCEDGAMPRITRAGNIGEAPVPSDSPTSPSKVGTLDVLDVWEVECPGAPTLEVYHNMYRCGSPCPPAGTRLLPARAYSDYVQSYKAHDSGDLDEALALAEQAHAQSPTTELISLWFALLSQESGRLEQALTLYDEVLGITPDDAFSVLQKAMIHNELGQTEQALALTQKLSEVLELDHPLYAEARCAHATALIASQPEQARAMAKEACELGAQACC